MWGFRYVQYVRSTVLCRIFIFPLFRSTSYHMLHSSHFARTTNGGAEARDRGRGYIWQHKWHTYRVTCGAANANHIYYSRHTHLAIVRIRIQSQSFSPLHSMYSFVVARSFVRSLDATVRAHTLLHSALKNWWNVIEIYKIYDIFFLFFYSSLPFRWHRRNRDEERRERRVSARDMNCFAAAMNRIEYISIRYSYHLLLFYLNRWCYWHDSTGARRRSRSLAHSPILFIYSLNLKRIIYALRADFSIISIANSGWSNRRKLTTRE